VFGRPLDLAATRAPVVVAFLPPPGTPQAVGAIAAVHAALPRLEEAGVPVWGVIRSTLEQARDFIPREHVRFPVLVDATGATFDAWEVGTDRLLVRTLLDALRPRAARALASGWWGAVGRPAGPVGQLGAWFVVGRDGRLRYAAYGRSAMDAADPEALHAAACMA
jgi:peroxiredoxin